MSYYTVNLHLKPGMRQMFVYYLCYCLQSLLLMLRKNQFFSSPKTSQQSVRKPYRPLLVFNSPWVVPRKIQQVHSIFTHKIKGFIKFALPPPLLEGHAGEWAIYKSLEFVGEYNIFCIIQFKKEKDGVLAPQTMPPSASPLPGCKSKQINKYISKTTKCSQGLSLLMLNKLRKRGMKKRKTNVKYTKFTF